MGALVGSVARSVLQSSTRPALLVGPNADRPDYLVGRPRRRPSSWPEPLSVGELVVCVDGSAEAESALPVASAWANALGMSMIIVDKNLGPLLKLADQHYVIEKGRVVWSGDSETLQRESAVVEQFLGV